jgi:hypothetical protein
MNHPKINFEKVFLYMCKNGHLEEAIKLLEINSNIDISANDDIAFGLSCSHGHLKVAQWLFAVKPTIDISAVNEYPFRAACVGGYLDVAKWLLEIKPTINISAGGNFAFINVCFQEKYDIARWLADLFPEKYEITSVTLNPYKINYKILKNMKIITTKWVSVLEQCPICYENDSDLETICNHVYCKSCISKWLTTNNSCPKCRINIQDKGFYILKMNGN